MSETRGSSPIPGLTPEEYAEWQAAYAAELAKGPGDEGQALRRAAERTAHLWGVRSAPDGTPVLNPDRLSPETYAEMKAAQSAQEADSPWLEENAAHRPEPGDRSHNTTAGYASRESPATAVVTDSPHKVQPAHGIAKVPDLSKLPAEPTVPDGESVNIYSLQSMTDYLDALNARDAYHHASRAAELQQSGGSHQDIMRALAAAEMAAPDKDRSFHAGRLDQYASAHGLRGWYRHQTSHGEHRVQVNKIRTSADGDKGRYYASDPFGKGTPRVVDRDTGKFVTPAVDPKAARDWISNAESPKAGPPAGSARAAASRTTTPAARAATQPSRRSRGR